MLESAIAFSRANECPMEMCDIEYDNFGPISILGCDSIVATVCDVNVYKLLAKKYLY